MAIAPAVVVGSTSGGAAEVTVVLLDVDVAAGAILLGVENGAFTRGHVTIGLEGAFGGADVALLALEAGCFARRQAAVGYTVRDAVLLIVLTLIDAIGEGRCHGASGKRCGKGCDDGRLVMVISPDVCEGPWPFVMRRRLALAIEPVLNGAYSFRSYDMAGFGCGDFVVAQGRAMADTFLKKPFESMACNLTALQRTQFAYRM